MKWAVSLLLLFLGPDSASGQAWPRKSFPPAGAGDYTVKTEVGAFVYETKSFRIVTFKKHDHTLMSNFAQCLESVPLALKATPIPLYAPPNEKQKQIILTANEDDYLDAGGARNTAGYYNGAKSKIIINWSHFKNKTAKTRLLQEPAFDLLVHESTHLSMHQLMWKCEPWLAEGIAEYIAASHLGRGYYDFGKIDRAIRKRVSKHTKPGTIGCSALAIKDLVSLSSMGWLNRTAHLDAWEALTAYNSALLLTHYCFHGGAERLERTRQHFEKLHSIKTGSRKLPRLFLAEETQEIETAITAYWRKRSLVVNFDHAR